MPSKPKKALQKFKKSDLKAMRKVDASDIAAFLNDFSQMVYGQDKKTKMISLRVPENILEAFRFQARKQGLRYQAMIVKLMREWIQKS